MFCKYCGGQIEEGANFCKHCGRTLRQPEATTTTQQTSVDNTTPTININVQNQTAAPVSTADLYPRESNSGLLQAAFIINLITTILAAVLIIPLAWCIPMTVHSYGIYKGTKPNTTGFGVCTLLFVSIISGILMLVADKDQ